MRQGTSVSIWASTGVVVKRLVFDRIGNQVVKRLVDTIGGLISLLLFLPIIAAFGVIVYVESLSTVFYRQRQLGRNGKSEMSLVGPRPEHSQRSITFNHGIPDSNSRYRDQIYGYFSVSEYLRCLWNAIEASHRRFLATERTSGFNT